MNWKDKSLIQPFVNQVLKDEAYKLKWVYDSEKEILKREPQSIGEAHERVMGVKNLSKEVKRCKNTFYTHKDLARKWGLDVFDGYEPYNIGPNLPR